MTWAKRKQLMQEHHDAVQEAAVQVCAVLREQARGGLGYWSDPDEAADVIEEVLLPRDKWDDPSRDPSGRTVVIEGDPRA